MTRLARIVFIVTVVAAIALPPLSAIGALNPLNDLLALGQAGGQSPAKLAVVKRAEPPLVATPRANCVSGGKKEPGIQGRVPKDSARDGFSCNTSLVAHQGQSGGFKVLRYTDTAGHTCAFYDTALLFPINALRLSGESLGVAVLDMSDPAHPRQTATLNSLPMLSPHESLALNPKRGLIGAVLGNPATYPGLVSIYDAHADCRHPVHKSTALVARFGHESGFAPDGKTFYATGTAVQAITAIDVTNPADPHPVWHGNVQSHGMTLSDDGNRAYIADPGGNMLILDTSEIQARKPKPQAREISRLSWKSATIPQNAIPFSVQGKPYVLEFDEYAGEKDAVGAGRIIDISDERAPRVVADLRLQVNQPADHNAAKNDPGAASPVQGYAAHYCNVPTQVDPTIVACSFIASGLRLFDIRDLTNPKEIGYYVAPTKAEPENFLQPSNFAMSQPAFDVARKQVWYSDGATGFNVIQVDPRVWPAARKPACLKQRAAITSNGVAGVRLGMTRAQLLRKLPAPRRRTKHSYRWCVTGGTKAVSAAFTKGGRVAAVTTTATGHAYRRVHAGSSGRSLRKAFPYRRSLGKGLVGAGRTSSRIFATGGGKVRYVAVASRATIATRSALRSYLRYAR